MRAQAEVKPELQTPISQGSIEAEAQVVSITRSTAVVRIDIRNEGRLACAAQGLVLIRDPKPR